MNCNNAKVELHQTKPHTYVVSTHNRMNYALLIGKVKELARTVCAETIIYV